jgi:hypothetical protein
VGFRLTVEHAWKRLRDHVVETGRLYFNRIRLYGHTHKSTWTAVVFSLVIWVAIAASVAFAAYWRISVVVLLVLPAAFLVVGWCLRGPRAGNHRFRFACTFFEPAVALVVPSLGSKLIDVGLQALKTAL